MSDNNSIIIPMPNDDDGNDNNDIMKMMQLAAMNINGLSQQMGLVLDKVNAHEERIIAIEDRLTNHERTEVVNRAQANRLQAEVHSRVNYLLDIEFEGGKVADESVTDDVNYRGGFIARCYADARHHSKMGSPYYATLKVDFDEVMQYLEAWVPEVEGGVEGYKQYLDIRREERMKKSAA